jgi:large subunit ribosomal protein L25
MADRPSLSVQERPERGSRQVRRLRRAGQVPAVLYGATHPEPVSLTVGAIELRRLLAEGASLFDVSIDGKAVPAILKDRQDHPVRGDVMHVDFLEVNLREKIQTTTVVELTGIEEAPGVVEGGVLDLATRELNIEALPTDIPEQIVVDVSQMEMGATLTLASVSAPKGVEFLDDVEETVVATVILPTVEEEPEIEEETELVGEEGEAAEGEEPAEGDAAEESSEGSDDSGE